MIEYPVIIKTCNSTEEYGEVGDICAIVGIACGVSSGGAFCFVGLAAVGAIEDKIDELLE